MQIVFLLECSVDVWLERRGRVDTPRPASCPSCGHSWVIFDGWRSRQTRRGAVDIHRVWCANAGCEQRSHSLLPDVLVPRRVDLVEVIGRALEAKASGEGHRPVAVRLGVPPATVRGWLRRAARTGGRVAARLMAVAASADPAVRGPPSERGPVVAVVGAAHLAAGAWSSLSGEPVEVWRYANIATAGGVLG